MYGAEIKDGAKGKNIESGSPVPTKEALILTFWLVQTLDNVRICKYSASYQF